VYNISGYFFSSDFGEKSKVRGFFKGQSGLYGKQSICFMPYLSSYLKYMLMFSSASGKILAANQTEVVCRTLQNTLAKHPF